MVGDIGRGFISFSSIPTEPLDGFIRYRKQNTGDTIWSEAGPRTEDGGFGGFRRIEGGGGGQEKTSLGGLTL